MQQLRNRTVLHQSICRFSSITSHKQWLHRHKTDQFVKLATEQGLRSRAAFKLQEIDKKFRLIPSHSKLSLVDCGCAPGGWLVYCQRKLGSTPSAIIGIDLLDVEPIPGVHLIKGDFTNDAMQAEIKRLLKSDGGCCDLVLSDMSPNHSGFKDVQHYASMRLARSALHFFVQVGKPKTGSFLCKYFAGEEEPQLLAEMKTIFKYVTQIKPTASRQESSEKYVLGIGKK